MKSTARSGYPPIPALHLAIRFVLELVMLSGSGMVGWGVWGYPGAIIAVLIAAGLWGVFGRRGDGSRGDPVVDTPGRIRLVLEIALFGLAAYGFWTEWSRTIAETFLTVSALHYGITWERQWWLLRNGQPGMLVEK